MRRGSFLLSAAATGVLTACAVNPPLLFGDNVTFGLELGTNAATGGGTVTLGYKQYSVAVVPVSILDEKNKAGALRAYDATGKDAMSVFAVFDSSTAGPSARVHIGQVFSTGSAAQALTQGLCNRLGGSGTCPKPAAESPGSAAAFAKEAKASAAKAEASAEKARKAAVPATGAAQEETAKTETPPATDRPYQSPLIYARTDVLGFDIGGSSAEQGVMFSLGYASRNLALIPVYAPSSGGRVTGLYGDLDTNTPGQDAYSVLGQFKADTQTTAVGYGIERYFATGIAAQNLSKGLGAAYAAPSPTSNIKK